MQISAEKIGTPAGPSRDRTLASLIAEHSLVAPLADAYSLAVRMVRAEISQHVRRSRETLGFKTLSEGKKHMWLKFENDVTLIEVAETLVRLVENRKSLSDFLIGFADGSESEATIVRTSSHVRSLSLGIRKGHTHE